MKVNRAKLVGLLIPWLVVLTIMFWLYLDVPAYVYNPYIGTLEPNPYKNTMLFIFLGALLACVFSVVELSLEKQ